MSSVDPALPAGLPVAQPTTAKAPKSTLDQGDFLRLLTAQLQNQDPTKPVDNFQYVQQMAMFAQVEGGSATNTKLDAVIARLDQLIAQVSPPEASN
ncbi:flagellar hook capping FlgD N-terminal domain-containing protein [Sandarakinorhabdus sp.]|jgi:flagellar basal-body rod modification protein FlgD|uniref:flagellar hook assembly protein FlgD n=1 Tax=Sandarakinorhabdus sp. TaxID=1916663 RepID=UPI0028A6E278|nr:flagellar hook capping FlgD N-terminal domain-containing protein [Sandarakinorhabdus sp.]